VSDPAAPQRNGLSCKVSEKLVVRDSATSACHRSPAGSAFDLYTARLDPRSHTFPCSNLLHRSFDESCGLTDDDMEDLKRCFESAGNDIQV